MIIKTYTHWIPVEVGMPKPNTPVLVTVDATAKSRPWAVYGCAFWDGSNWYTYMKPDHPKLGKLVLMWAPLPAA